MFTDAGAHLMQYTQQATDRRAYTLFSDYWSMSLAISEQRWNCLAHLRYRGSIEYRDTSDGIVIVVRISGIAQHYSVVLIRFIICLSVNPLDWDH